MSSFVGREAEKDGLRRCIDAASLITVTGPGGVGKSRLVLETATDLSRQGRRAVVVDVAALGHPRSILPAVATALGVLEKPPRSLYEGVVRRLVDDAVLLLLDGCEHERSSCAHLATDLLATCGDLRIVATSRERLGAAGEVVWPVPPLPLPRAGEPTLPGPFAGSAAVQLFCERAAALQPGFLSTAGNIEWIVEICRRLDGNPLAIELAAARVVALPAAEIAARLDDRFALLTGGPSTAPPRQRTLRACVEWSYNRLPLPERTLLHRLALIPGPFRISTAEEVCEDHIEPHAVLPLLLGLVDKSLLLNESTDDDARFRLSETVRAFALAVADAHPNARETGRTATTDATRVRGHRVRQPSSAWEALTRTEREVADLAARGLTNALIARELVVSRRTVETHLQRCYAKLGIRSRTQLSPFLPCIEEAPT